MGRGFHFAAMGVVFVLLGTVLFASRPATQFLAALAQNAPAQGNAPQGRNSLVQENGELNPNPQFREAFQGDFNGNTGNQNAQDFPSEVPAQANGGGKPDDKDNGWGIRNPIIEVLQKLVGEIPNDELQGADRDGVLKTLADADNILRDQKERNMRGILAANRQLRVRRCERTNVLVIVLDDVGFGELGCYGQQLIQTPYIDDLATRSIRFTQFYAGSSQDVASRGTLFSGKHTGHGVPSQGDWITMQSQDFTLPKVMYQGGFDTGYIGKWSMGDAKIAGTPSVHAIQHFFGYRNAQEAENVYPEHLWSNGDKIEIPGNADGKREAYVNDLIGEDAARFLKRHSEFQYLSERDTETARISGSGTGEQAELNRRRVTETPFFLTVAFSMPVTDAGADVPSDKPYTDTRWPQPKKNYAAMITHVDRNVGVILNALEKYGLSDNTIVILTSDSGPRTNDVVDTEFFDTTGNLRGQQVDLYEGAIRVPLLICQPSGAGPGDASGRRSGVSSQTVGATHGGGYDSRALLAMWDLPATIADMTHCMRRPNGDGVSRMAMLDPWTYEVAETSPDKKKDEPFYWEVREGEISQAVRMGDWKFVRTGAKGAWQLYNLKSDLAETRNVAAENPDLIQKIDSWVADVQAPAALARGEEE